MSIILRPYQEKAVEKAVWATRLPGNDLLVLSTGSGKSIIIAEIANRLQKKILILQPNREILEQNYAKLRHFVPASDIGIFSASMNQKRVSKYTFATIGSIYRCPYYFDDIELILIDEVHLHNMKNKDSMYEQFFSAIGRPKLIGLTATPYRNVQGWHTEKTTGEVYAKVTLKLINRMKPDAKTECFWNRILINIGIADLIRDGYLSPFKYELNTFLTQEEMKLNQSESDFDLDDYSIKLGIKQQQLVDSILDAQKRFKSVLVFCPSVSAAEKYSMVVPGSACVSAKTPDEERDQIIRDFKSGKIQTVFNMNVLTVGFDHPALDCIVLARPTRSLPLYVQMLGRGARIADGKTHCTVIDWSNTVEKLGQVETVELRKEQLEGFKNPMWDIFSQTMQGEERWHNRPLYSFKVSKDTSKKSYFMKKAMQKKYGRRY